MVEHRCPDCGLDMERFSEGPDRYRYCNFCDKRWKRRVIPVYHYDDRPKRPDIWIALILFLIALLIAFYLIIFEDGGRV